MPLQIMTDTSTERCHELMQRLREVYPNINSRSELYESTLEIGADIFDADVCLIAEKDDAGLRVVASEPPEWTDSDGLLSPASIPSLTASREISYHITNRGDVRGAAQAEPLSKTSAIEYESVLIVPFSAERVLIVGGKDEESFADSDLEVLRIISSFASILTAQIEQTAEPQRLEENLTEVMAGLSHDANNFFGIIEGRLEIAREDPRAEHFDAIERATHRLSELIKDTRTLLETGAFAADLEPVHLSEAGRDAWQVVQHEDADLVMSTLKPVQAERSQLYQLLENLFRNSVKHAGPEVIVWVGMLSDEQGFYVEDNGPGIDPGERDSIFEFGYSNADEHTGLGLNIVKRIANAHGWDVTVTQGNMGGVRFEFSGVEVVT